MARAPSAKTPFGIPLRDGALSRVIEMEAPQSQGPIDRLPSHFDATSADYDTAGWEGDRGSRLWTPVGRERTGRDGQGTSPVERKDMETGGILLDTWIVDRSIRDGTLQHLR